jgi:uncharacterized protein (TIGR02611 family)
MKKMAITAAGFLTIVAGIIMLVAPGPGLLTIAGGLAILAKRYRWARVLLDKVRAEIKKQAQKVRGRRQRQL